MIVDKMRKTKLQHKELRKPTQRILLLMPSKDKKGPALETTKSRKEARDASKGAERRMRKKPSDGFKTQLPM